MDRSVLQELEIIRNESGGFLHPAKIVEYARDEASALHTHFIWDNDEAAEKYRIAQARALIRVCVVVEKSTSQQTRAYVSLSVDRKDGGYRAMVDIVNDEILLDVMLRDAIKELASFTRKYNELKQIAEIGPLFTIIDETVKRVSMEEEARISA